MTSATEKQAEPEALAFMLQRGGDWFAYENHDMGHPDLGHLKFLRCGVGCTFVDPPLRFPDSSQGLGWRYVLVGAVDLTSGVVRPLTNQ